MRVSEKIRSRKFGEQSPYPLGLVSGSKASNPAPSSGGVLLPHAAGWSRPTTRAAIMLTNAW